MSRILFHSSSNEMIELMGRSHVEYRAAIEIEAKSGAVRAHSGVGDLIINGKTFYGVGTLGAISAARQVGDSSPQSVTANLSLIDKSMLAHLINEKLVGTRATIFNTAIDGQKAVSDVSFSGFISDVGVKLGDSSEYAITITDELSQWSKPSSARNTSESHAARNSGDQLLRYIVPVSTATVYWGSVKNAPPMVYK